LLLNGKALGGAFPDSWTLKMKLIAILAIALVGTAHGGSPDRSLLQKASSFSSLVGDEPCLSENGAAFLRLLHREAVDEFMQLAKAGRPAGQLYALCGLEVLRAPGAAALRKRLSKMAVRTELHYGCVPQTDEVRAFFRKLPHETPTQFDQICQSLTGIQESSKVVMCDERRARPTSR
jgi:hypothetical protein